MQIDNKLFHTAACNIITFCCQLCVIPTEFFKENSFSYSRDANSPVIDSAKPNNNLLQEKFVFIKRVSF